MAEQMQWKELARSLLLGFLVGAVVMVGLSLGMPEPDDGAPPAAAARR